MSDQLVGKKGSDYPKLEDFTEEQRTAFLGSTLVHAVGKLKASDVNFTDANLTLSDLKTDQIQADWNEQDDTKVSYIKNKPEIPSIAGLATEGYVDSQVSGKQDVIDDLEGIRSNAELGATAVQPDVLYDYAHKTDLPTAESLAGPGLLETSGKLKLNTDNSLTIYEVGYHDDRLSVAVPVPAPSGNHADVGKVLTVKTNSETMTDELVWDMPTSPQVTVDDETITNGDNGLQVNPGYGLTIGSGALCAHIRSNAGLESDSSGIRVVPDKGIMITSRGGVGINFTGASDGKVLTAHETEDTDEDDNQIYDVEWKSIEGVPTTSGASDGDVLTYKDSDGIVWAPAQGGGGGGLAYNEVNLVAEVPSGVTSYKQYNFNVPSNNTYNVLNGVVAMDDMENRYHLYINVPSDLAASSEPLNVWIECVVAHDPNSSEEENKLALVVNFNGVTMYPQDGKLDLSGTKIDPKGHEPIYYYIISKKGTTGQYFQLQIVGHAFGIWGIPASAGT